MFVFFPRQTASRMESNGVPACIHLSNEMYDAIINSSLPKQFDFECCGKMPIKGKGEMITYLAKTKKEELKYFSDEVCI